VTRSPCVSTCVQSWPPSCVTNRAGPNAQPSLRLRKRISLTPAAPSGGPAAGACTPPQLRPASLVRATQVHDPPAQLAPDPEPAPDLVWPITQPVSVPPNGPDPGWKPPGTASWTAPAAAVPAPDAPPPGAPTPGAPAPDAPDP